MYQVICKSLLDAAQEAYIGGKMSELPILNHALVCFSNGRLTITMFNFDEHKTATCNVRTIGNDMPAFLIPMKSKAMKCDGSTEWKTKPTGGTLRPFIDWLKATDKNEVLTLEFNPLYGKLTIKAGNTKATFNCLPHNEFPAIPGLEYEYNMGKDYRLTPNTPAVVAPVQPAAEKPAQAETLEPSPAADPRAEILARYAWIERWENDPQKRMYKSTLHNARVNMRNELAALEAIDVTAVWPVKSPALVTVKG